MASRSAAEKDGWWPRLGRGGGTRAPSSSCGGMAVELDRVDSCRNREDRRRHTHSAGKEGWMVGWWCWRVRAGVNDQGGLGKWRARMHTHGLTGTGGNGMEVGG